MGYRYGDSGETIMMEVCSILERELDNIASRLKANPAPLDLKDSEHIAHLTQAIANIKKAMRIGKEMEMAEEHWEPEMYEPMQYGGYGRSGSGNSGGGRSGGGQGGGSFGAGQSGNNMGGYGRNRSRDSRGRFMDNETTSMVHNIMSETNDERTREQLRSLLERM